MQFEKMATSAAFRGAVCFHRKLKSRLLMKDASAVLSKMYSSQERLVETEQVGNVYLVGINRPEVRNCVDLATARQLHHAFTEFEQNEQLWVAVLYGKGGCFCSGYDLTALSNSDGRDLDSTDPKIMRPMGPSGMVFNKPVIAAVNGYAVAGGLELALMCDMRVVEESATMGVFCRRWGVPLVDGGTVRLQKLIGLSRALDLILTGRPVKGEEAHAMGLANRVCPTGTAVGQATKLAQLLCLFPQGCLRADRRSAYHAAYDATTIEDALSFEWESGMQVVQTEAITGATRFKHGAGRHGNFDMRDPSKSKL